MNIILKCGLLANECRNQLENAISDLETISQFKDVLNKSLDFIPENIEQLDEMLDRTERKMYQLSQQVEQQNQDIDRLLNIYENLVC